jgi:hypothetical protein
MKAIMGVRKMTVIHVLILILALTTMVANHVVYDFVPTPLTSEQSRDCQLIDAVEGATNAFPDYCSPNYGTVTKTLEPFDSSHPFTLVADAGIALLALLAIKRK